jgi:dolichyl-phosphate-mannose--protein O-mannosyl transferase
VVLRTMAACFGVALAPLVYLILLNLRTSRLAAVVGELRGCHCL